MAAKVDQMSYRELATIHESLWSSQWERGLSATLEKCIEDRPRTVENAPIIVRCSVTLMAGVPFRVRSEMQDDSCQHQSA